MFKKAITLIEVMVVVIVLGILAAIALSNVSNVRKLASSNSLKTDKTTVQQAIDRFYLKNGIYPVVDVVNFGKGKPKHIDWTLVVPEYLHAEPNNLDRIYYWVDFTGKVYISDADSPKGIAYNTSTKELSWDDNILQAQKFNIGYIVDEQYVWVGESNNSSYTMPASVPVSVTINDIVVSTISQNDLESAPVGNGYAGGVLLPEGGTPVPSVGGIKDIVIGYDYSLALLNDGTVMAWGYNDYGQLGTGDNVGKSVPTKIQGLSNVKQIAIGDPHSVALLNDGTLMSWGRNTYGQLGLGDTVNRNTPTPVPGITGVKKIYASEYQTFALLDNGNVLSVGQNLHGILGLNLAEESVALTFSQIPVISDVKELYIAKGYEPYAFAILNNGSVYSWGENYSAQLGVGDDVLRYEPTLVTALNGVKELSLSYYFGLALMNDGTVKSWGLDFYGEIGLPTYEVSGFVMTPRTISGLADVKQVATGDYHSLALLNNGTVLSWGDNSSGALGLGNKTDRSTPTVVTGLNSVSKLIADGAHSIALMSDGTIKICGNNYYGQQGNGTSVDQTTFTTVSELNDINQVIIKENDNIVILNDNTVFGWGRNRNGILGVGDELTKTVPTEVTIIE